MRRFVIVNSYEACIDALLKKGTDFAGRNTYSEPMRLQSRGFKGLGSSDYSKSWSFLRKISYKSMHLYGSGMKKIEEKIVHQVDWICEELAKEEGKPVLIHKFLGNVE